VRPLYALPTVWFRPNWLKPVIQRQSMDPAKSITSAEVSATDTLTLLIKVPATVTFYRGHRRTLYCLPVIISLIIMCVGIIFTQFLLHRQTRLTRAAAWIEPRTNGTEHTSRSAAHGAQVVVYPLDCKGSASSLVIVWCTCMLLILVFLRPVVGWCPDGEF